MERKISLLRHFLVFFFFLCVVRVFLVLHSHFLSIVFGTLNQQTKIKMSGFVFRQCPLVGLWLLWLDRLMALISVGWWLSTVVVCFFFSNKLLRSTSFALIFYFCLLFFFSICWLNMRFVFCVGMFLVVSSVLIFPFACLPFYFTLSLFVSLLCIQYNRGNIVILFLFFFIFFIRVYVLS